VLEDKIRNDPKGIELKSLCFEVGLVHKEREKQTTLIAGISFQDGIRTAPFWDY
jgi:hypothetical protein